MTRHVAQPLPAAVVLKLELRLMRPTVAIFEMVTGRTRVMCEAPAQRDRSKKQGDETANTHVHEKNSDPDN
jgi:hypothetical protein